MTPRRYREHPPCPVLAPYVSCFWSRAGGGKQTRVLPDGAVDIIFDLGEAAARDSAYLVGAMTRPLVVARSRGRDFVSVRFRPGGAWALFGGSMMEFRDRRVPLLDLWPDASGWVDRLRERRRTEERLRLLEKLLVSRVARSCRPEPRVAFAVREIERRQGRMAVENLSGLLGVTRQHLGRLFDRHVGVGVKFFSRVVRLQSLLDTLQRPHSEPLHQPGQAADHHPPHDWASLALDFGFYDQSHLVSDFKALTGLTPCNWQPNVRGRRSLLRGLTADSGTCGLFAGDGDEGEPDGECCTA